MGTKSLVMARAVVEAADLAAPVEAAITVFAHAAGPAILESSRPINTYGRFSILAADPVEVISLVGGDSHEPLGALAAAMARYPGLPGPTAEMPFVGGWIGFLSYEAGLPVEGITPHADAVRNGSSPQHSRVWTLPDPPSSVGSYDPRSA
ncbi:MAG: hypothetical protein AAB385_09265, partial [Planctomycetota bacterium]